MISYIFEFTNEQINNYLVFKSICFFCRINSLCNQKTKKILSLTKSRKKTATSSKFKNFFIFLSEAIQPPFKPLFHTYNSYKPYIHGYSVKVIVCVKILQKHLLFWLTDI